MKRIPYGKHFIEDVDLESITEVLKSPFITQGPKVEAFEKEVASFHNAKYAVAFSSGTAAIHGIYHSMGVKEGSDVLVPAITFVATANGALYCGGTPVLVDIDPDTYCMDLNELDKKADENTRVISIVSMGGYPVDLEKYRKIADKYGAFLFHDAAHSIGSKRNGSFGLEFADAAMVSFHPVKHVTTGEGGMILTNNRDLYNKLVLFRSHGITKKPEEMSRNDGPWFYQMQDLGYNYRMSDIAASLGLSQFKRLEENLQVRNKWALYYFNKLKKCDFFQFPPNLGFEELNKNNWNDKVNLHSFHLFILKLNEGINRLDFYNYLISTGIMVQIHYIPIHYHPYYQKKFNINIGDFPNSEDYYSRVISIPMFHSLKLDEIDYVIKAIIDYNEILKNEVD